MKKFLLSLAALGVSAAGWSAQLGPQPIKGAPDSRFRAEKCETFTPAPSNAVSRGSEVSVDYTLASTPQYGIGLNDAVAGDEIGMAFQMTADEAARFAGNYITSINFYTGLNNNTKRNHIKQAKVFITEDLTKDPVYTQSYTITTIDPFTQVKVDLSTPYQITGDKSFYVCVSEILTTPADMPVTVDYMAHDGVAGGWVGVIENGNWVWENITAYYGFTCLGATISGESMPMNQISILDSALPTIALEDAQFPYQVLITNEGANDVTTVEIEYSLGSAATVTEPYSFSRPLTYGSYAVLSIDDLSSKANGADGVDFKFAITKVNGVANTSKKASDQGNVLIIPQGKGFKKNVVVEEMTGLWCPNCPLGYGTMEEVHEQYKELGIIPVGVHTQDALESTTYVSVAGMTSGGVPTALVNRQVETYPYPLSDLLKTCDEIGEMPAVGKIELEVTSNPDNARQLTFHATTEYIFDMPDAADRYYISFGVTENQLGPYEQQNKFAGSTEDYGGWENEPAIVNLVFNDVARLLYNPRNSVPASVEADKPYTFDYTATVSRSMKLDNCNYVAYLIEAKTGAVENVAFVPAANYEEVSGIEEVESADAAPIEYFNLQGMRVANPEAGVYIRRQGSSVSKVFVK